MAVVEQDIAPTLLTYESYLSEGEVNARYDIVDGQRVLMTQPSFAHQNVVLNIAEQLRRYQRQTRRGRVIIAPCDVLITTHPLRTRQPDVLFISNERFGATLLQEAKPLDPAPELVVEVLSPSETPAIREGKLRDFGTVGVQECWVVSIHAQTVEVLQFMAGHPQRTALHEVNDKLISTTFPDLTLAVADIFSE